MYTSVQMASCLYETLLQGIMVVLFIKINIQSKLVTYHDSPQAHLTEGIGQQFSCGTSVSSLNWNMEKIPRSKARSNNKLKPKGH